MKTIKDIDQLHEIEVSDSDFNKLDEEYDFLLDVSASVKNTKCPSFYTPKQDGLHQPWNVIDVKRGKVWCFPPQTQTINMWAEKALYECNENGVSTIMYMTSIFLNEKWVYNIAKHVTIKILQGERKFLLEGETYVCKEPWCLVSFRPHPAVRGFVLLEDLFSEDS